MPQNSSKVCSHDTIYETIRDQIALLNYEPGEPLRESELQKEFNCSRTPIREALITLEAEGLVERIPQSGTFVSKVGFGDLKELLLIRKHLYILVGRLVAKNISDTELRELKNALEKMKHIKDSRTLIEMDLNLHRKIDRATHNRYLIRFLKTLEVQATRVWLFEIDSSVTEEFSSDFENLLKALQDRNKELSGKILSMHTQKTIDALSGQLKKI